MSSHKIGPLVDAYGNWQMANLIKEVQMLRAALDSKGAVTITGRGGAPVYATGSLEDAETIREPFFHPEVRRGGVSRHVHLESNANARCSIKEVEEAEVRVGGLLVAAVFRCSMENDENCESLEGDEYCSWSYHWQSPCEEEEQTSATCIHSLFFRFGPLPQEFRRADVEVSPSAFSNEQIHEVIFDKIVFNDTGNGSIDTTAEDDEGYGEYKDGMADVE